MAEYGREDDSFRKVTAALQDIDEGKTVDTLELGLLASRDFQGPYECDFSFEGNEGFLHNFKHCRKNEGHNNFMPVKNFIAEGFNCLPDGYKDPSVFNFIKIQADLTVNIKIKYASCDRPEVHPRTGLRYLFGVLRGKKIGSTGTGSVVKVDKRKVEDGNPCMCESGKSGGKQCDRFCSITVATARHVVYDQLEASVTSIEGSIFTDEGEKKFSMSGGKHCQVNSDASLLTFCLHHDDVGALLSARLKQLQEGRIETSQLFNTTKERAFLPIVSHPHGLDKQVSFGFILNEVVHNYRELPTPLSNIAGLPDMLRDAYNFSPHAILYDTPTCPGSSGAFIFHKDNMFKFLTGSIHEGCYRGDNKNFSGDNSSLEQVLRNSDQMPTKLDIQRRLKTYLKGYQSKSVPDSIKELSDHQKVFSELRRAAMEMPKELELSLSVKKKLDDERAFDFRRAAYKVYKLCPPGTMALAADILKSLVDEMKKDYVPFIDRFFRLRPLKAEFGKRFDNFDELTGGPVRERKEGEEVTPSHLVTTDYLVQEALAIQDFLLNFVVGSIDTKEAEVASIRALFDDPSNKENLYRLFSKGNLKDDDDSIDTTEVDTCFDELWKNDPALLRSIVAMMEFK